MHADDADALFQALSLHLLFQQKRCQEQKDEVPKKGKDIADHFSFTGLRRAHHRLPSLLHDHEQEYDREKRNTGSEKPPCCHLEHGV